MRKKAELEEADTDSEDSSEAEGAAGGSVDGSLRNENQKQITTISGSSGSAVGSPVVRR